MFPMKNLISKEGDQKNTSELTPFPLLPLPKLKRIMLALEEKLHQNRELTFYVQDGILETFLSFLPLF